MVIKKPTQEKNEIDEMSPESVTDAKTEITKTPENFETESILPEDEAQNRHMRHQIEIMDLPDSAKAQAQVQANALQPLENQKKVQHLLVVAKTKGVVFAVHVAKKMDDPYLLDTFHDALIKEGYYKEFTK